MPNIIRSLQNTTVLWRKSQSSKQLYGIRSSISKKGVLLQSREWGVRFRWWVCVWCVSNKLAVRCSSNHVDTQARVNVWFCDAMDASLCALNQFELVRMSGFVCLLSLKNYLRVVVSDILLAFLFEIGVQLSLDLLTTTLYTYKPLSLRQDNNTISSATSKKSFFFYF